MKPRVRKTSAFDLLAALIEARHWQFDQTSATEIILQVQSERFSHSYQLRAQRNEDLDSLSFYIARELIFPWKQRDILQKTARRLNFHGGRFTFSINANNELRLSCPTYIGRKKPEHKAQVVERYLDDAMVRMDCGWDAVQTVLHAGKDAVDAVHAARIRAYGGK